MTGAQEWEAKQDIAEVLLRYATGIDQRDWELFETCFTGNCHCDYGDVGVWERVEAITAFMVDAHAGVGHTLHRITNIAINVDDEVAATARCYVDAVIMARDGGSGVNAMGYYDDELVHTPVGWRIARRRYTMVHVGAVG
ncbi:MAG: nuclear transport factor 2 family protein [Acidimicrobiales bacterium]|nr:nuclear transport factor 2 family protein [Acidimicrobiales bacterium]